MKNVQIQEKASKECLQGVCVCVIYLCFSLFGTSYFVEKSVVVLTLLCCCCCCCCCCCDSCVYYFFFHFLQFCDCFLPDQHSRMEVVGVAAVGVVVVVGVVVGVGLAAMVGVGTTEEEEAGQEAAGVVLYLFVHNEVFFQYQTNVLLIVL